MRTTLSIILAFTFVNAFGQSVTADTTFFSNNPESPLAFYETVIGSESHLFNGSEYITNHHFFVSSTGHPFFKSDNLTEGSVFYDGALYTNVPLLYDILRDQVVIDPPGSTFRVKLISEKIKYFKLRNHSFIRLVKSDSANSSLPTGFYELLVDNKIKVLAKRTKNQRKETTLAGLKGYYWSTDSYYIEKNNTYYPVKDKRTFIDVFPGKKKEIQKYARVNKLNFRRRREEAIIKIAKYGESLL